VIPSGLYHVATLGCKLNQYDSAAMEADLAALGMAPTPDPSAARLILVNTCTVTSAADAQSRQTIRKMKRANPRCTLVVTGCYAQRDPAALRAIPGVDAVMGLSQQRGLKNLVTRLLPEVPAGIACVESGEDPLPLFSDQTRAFLKIQEGCDLRCSYCVIPSVRGASRSVPPEAVLRKIALLSEAGFREIVLTGVNTGDYGKDLHPATTLADLLRRAVDIPSLGRIRLNSVEPRCVTEALVHTLAVSPKLAPHLQVPLQSGSDPVLARMRRPYRVAHYRRALETLRKHLPDMGLGADVIVGFPGETEDDHARTRDFIAGSELNYLHVFSFAPRPGTPAATAGGRIEGTVVARRSTELRELGRTLARRFQRSFLGRELEVIGLHGARADGKTRALSGNFIEVALEAPAAHAVNRLIAARVTDVSSHPIAAVPC
jgi:threonylcarbamoyladenosine tRNA methylthiotransferase MtaB